MQHISKDSPSVPEYFSCNENTSSDKIVDAANHTPICLKLTGENTASSSLLSLGGSVNLASQGSRDRLFNCEIDQTSLRIDNIRTRSLSFGRTISRSDIEASALKILSTFVVRGAERKIDLPPILLSKIIKSIEQSRYDPEIFEAAKVHVFEAIERHEFPNFLKCRGLQNLGPSSRLSRLFVGLLAMFGGFWVGFIYILLDTPVKNRCWVSIFSPL